MNQQRKLGEKKNIGLLEMQAKRGENQSAFTVIQSIGQTSVTNMKELRKENNISEKINFVLVVVRKDTEKTNASVEDSITAKQNATLAYCDKGGKGSEFTGFSQSVEETLSPIIPVVSNGKILWGFLHSGSGRNFISTDVIKMLKLR